MSSLNLIRNKKEPILEKPYSSLGKEEIKSVMSVMRKRVLSGFIGRAGKNFLGGEYVRRFEDNFKKYFRVKHAVSFNSATTALQAALAAIAIEPGDEVITSPFTMTATATAILFNNALPVFADINEHTYCLEAQSVEKVINKNTKGVISVNLFGGSPNNYHQLLKLIKQFKLKIIEDNSQAPGGKYKDQYLGTIGDVGIFSLNAAKTIQCGEGGILVTNDNRIAFRAQLYRNHGEMVIDDLRKDKIYEPIIGSNFRLSELHAAIASSQLKKLTRLNKLRTTNAEYLTRRLAKFDWLVPFHPPKEVSCVYFLYPFRFLYKKIGIKRDTFIAAMSAEGFTLGAGYQKPLYLLPVYQKRKIYQNSNFPFSSKDYQVKINYSKGICPIAERMFYEELVTTTLFQPPNSKVEIDQFIKALEKIEENIGPLVKYEKRNSH